MKTATIQINGKLYDAHTGQLLQNLKSNDTQDVSNLTVSSAKIHHATISNNHRTLDGITRRKALTHKPAHKKPSIELKQVTNHPNITSKPKLQNTVLQRSNTLNRKSVLKPNTKPKPYIHAISATNNKPNPKIKPITDKTNNIIAHIPEQRLKRAQIAQKSTVISKFGINHKKPSAQTTYLSIQQPPANQNNAVPPVPPPAIHHLALKKQYRPHHPKKMIFEEQIQNANSHLLKPIKKPRTTHKFIRKLHLSPKTASVLAGFTALVLISSFFAYQRIPTISMKVAANQTGVNGTIPSSVPAGYSFSGPVKAIDNAVALTYKSSSDDRQFVLSQRKTNWSSESLLTNFLQESKLNYQVYKENGLTIYIYDGSNATWVDKGVWYNLNSNQNSLSASQLLEIASSS